VPPALLLRLGRSRQPLPAALTVAAARQRIQYMVSHIYLRAAHPGTRYTRLHLQKQHLKK
jgi:hypothetical protein